MFFKSTCHSALTKAPDPKLMHRILGFYYSIYNNQVIHNSVASNCTCFESLLHGTLV
ncbi:uncharacterized protein DS421_13g413050 [Arachis hypogaea]|nr:uncharacterized protein DS421_13g413050 [Arachis hypogaea]